MFAFSNAVLARHSEDLPKDRQACSVSVVPRPRHWEAASEAEANRVITATKHKKAFFMEIIVNNSIIIW